jgi:RNA polymerase sigma-70 factor (ECF subfamily)
VEFLPDNELESRLNAVLHVLYLLFNEGYNSSPPEMLIRTDLCDEAQRLCGLLLQHPLYAKPSVKTNTIPFRASILACQEQ